MVSAEASDDCRSERVKVGLSKRPPLSSEHSKYLLEVGSGFMSWLPRWWRLTLALLRCIYKLEETAKCTHPGSREWVNQRLEVLF